HSVSPPPAVTSLCFLHRPPPHRYLPSFPTRRSSDLLGQRLLPQPRPGARLVGAARRRRPRRPRRRRLGERPRRPHDVFPQQPRRSEEHASELQSLTNLLSPLLLDNKNQPLTQLTYNL